MSTSSSSTYSIQQLWELSGWDDLISALDAALDSTESYSGTDLLTLCAMASQYGHLSAARKILRKALSTGLVSKQETKRLLIASAQESLAKVRGQFALSGTDQVKASIFVGGAVTLSSLSRWYRSEGELGVYTRNQLTESPLAEISSECAILIERLQSCSDKSLGSIELKETVAECGYTKLFSVELADAFRPFSAQLDGLRVLVLDSEAGVQTRFFAECGASVTTVTTNPEHALLTAALCADLPKVHVVLDSPHLVPFRGLFDLVIITGYHEEFLARSGVLSPLDHLLKRAYFALVANGSLLLAGHNGLALRHFNNQRDVYGREGSAALEGRFNPGMPHMLSSSVVEASLARCGFYSHDHCAVMGPINKPKLIVSPKGCELPAEQWNLGTLVRRSLWQGSADRLARFSESRVMRAIVERTQLPTWSDGYLVLSHKSSEPQLCLHDWLASYFICNTGQSIRSERRFRLIQADAESIEVTTHTMPGSDAVTVVPYIKGAVYRDNLDDLLQVPGWTFEQILQWSTIWLRCLLSSLDSNDSLKPEGEIVANYQGHYDLWVPEWLLGATPERWIKTAEGEFKCLHKRINGLGGTLPMAAVLFAGLTSVFSSIRSVAEPADSTWLRPELLAVVLIERLGFAIDRADIDVIRGEWLRVNTIPLPNAGYFQPREISRSLTDVAKLYWATETEGFSEDKASSDILIFDGSLQTLRLPIAIANQKLKALRFDVANRPGCFEIEDMSVVGADGEVLWRWRHLRDGLSNIQGASLLTDVEAGRSCVLSRGDDPQFVLNLSQSVLDAAAGGVLKVVCSAWPQRL